MYAVARRRLEIDAIEDGVVVPDGVIRGELVGIEKTSAAKTVRRKKVSEPLRSEGESSLFRNRSEGAVLGGEASIGSLPQPGLGVGIHHQTRFVPEFRVGSTGYQFH